MSVAWVTLKRFFRGEQGGLTPAFAILLPCLLGMMSFGLDSANLLAAKTRVANAVDEASLALSATGKSNLTKEEHREAKEMVSRYLRYHFPELSQAADITLSSVGGNYDTHGYQYTRYQVNARIKVPLIFNTGVLKGFDHDIEVGSGTRKVNKYNAVPADYVFVVDFSGSQAGEPLRIIKQVVKEIGAFVLENSKESKIAIVPFSIGVPVKLPGVNERGGERVGCSVLFVPKPAYDIDYAFWSDKYIVKGKDMNNRMYYMDNQRYTYYRSFVGPASPKMNDADVIAKWCKQNPRYGVTAGRAQYTCKTAGYPDTDIFSERSQRIIAKEMDMAFQVTLDHNRYDTILHEKSVDYAATLDSMFSDKAVITFPMLWTELAKRAYRPFNGMCHNGGWYKHIANNDLSRSTARSWLIELTSDTKVLDQFQQMLQQGWTQISSGLIRSVPVMMKGKNKRKVFIMLSDGNDAPSAVVTETFLKKYDLCGRIAKGLIGHKETNTSKVELYYISTTSGAERVKFWADYCVGPERAKTSTTKDQLIREIKGIVTDEAGHFVA